MVLLDPEGRSFFVDWEVSAEATVANLRASAESWQLLPVSASSSLWFAGRVRRSLRSGHATTSSPRHTRLSSYCTTGRACLPLTSTLSASPAPLDASCVASIAADVGVSRATLAKRFAELVGETPLAYLTEWRMTLAADLLTDGSTMTISRIAREVGYSDAFAFSAAFKRVRGMSPSAHGINAHRWVSFKPSLASVCRSGGYRSGRPSGLRSD